MFLFAFVPLINFVKTFVKTFILLCFYLLLFHLLILLRLLSRLLFYCVLFAFAAIVSYFSFCYVFCFSCDRVLTWCYERLHVVVIFVRGLTTTFGCVRSYQIFCFIEVPTSFVVCARCTVHL